MGRILAHGLGGRSDTLLPIAVGSTLGHCFSLLVLEGQNGCIRASDPSGQGWDL